METFQQKKKKATSAFHKLYYEILSRYHESDFDIAINEMSEDMRDIVLSCHIDDIMELSLAEKHLILESLNMYWHLQSTKLSKHRDNLGDIEKKNMEASIVQIQELVNKLSKET